jgi:hypothetical protein
MYLTMNRFKVKPGREADFEAVWTGRDSLVIGRPQPRRSRDIGDHEVPRDRRHGAFGSTTSLMWMTSPICLPVRSTVM